MFTCWAQEMLDPVPDIITIDGKTVRGCFKKGATGIHMVNAGTTKKGIALGQLKVDAKPHK